MVIRTESENFPIEEQSKHISRSKIIWNVFKEILDNWLLKNIFFLFYSFIYIFLRLI